MSPNPYPIPSLEKTLAEVKTIYQQLFSGAEFSKFEEALLNADLEIQEHYKTFQKFVADKQNWSTEMFQTNLLSIRSPIPSSTAISCILQPIESKKDISQSEQASAIIYSIAKLFVNPLILQKQNPVEYEKTQQKNMFATIRLPEKICDKLINFSESRHVIVVCKGVPYTFDILDQNRQPINYNIIKANVDAILKSTEEKQNVSICELTALNRDKWSEYRNQMLKTAKQQMDLFQSGIITVILEDFDLDLKNPIKAYDILRDSKIRNFDQTTNFIVYGNGVTGLICEHSAVDGLIMIELAAVIRKMITEFMQKNDSTDVVSIPFTAPPSQLLFNLETVEIFPESLKNEETITFFDFDIFADISNLLKDYKLYDAWIVMAIQIALNQTFDNGSALLVAVPSHVRHFVDGRCDSTYINNKKTEQLFEYLKTANIAELLNDPKRSQTGMKLFLEALEALKNKIRETKCGNAFGTHIAVIRRMLENEKKHQELKNMLQIFAAPSVVITGAADVKENINFGTGNIYASNQICINYLGGKNDVRITIRANGIFNEKIKQLQESLRETLKIMLIFAVQIGIIKEMGATKILLHATSSTKKEMNKKLTFAIHGGAGEMTAMMPEMIGIIKFALNIAILIGVDSFYQNDDGNVIEVVEAVTKALEDCFIFNAGKGSVFNVKGEHELEASIMDGLNGKAGAVACIKKLKNPISAALKVMNECKHVFLCGNFAEDFCSNLECVEQKYFDTDLRKQQWKTVKNQMKMVKNDVSIKYEKIERCQMLAPQTVGAVAVDENGRLASATSTGGLINKMEGRIGDTAVIGAATWADKNVAVSCTGDGEEFLRKAVASKIAFTYDGNLAECCNKILKDDMSDALAGIVAIDVKGEIVGITNAQMFFGSYSNGKITTKIVNSKDNDFESLTK
uniref:Choline/carnitine acyltransferase domain-containing protein n=1 Tax=Panagrolaimus sp. ES5 TaxID=591445 RepID=A0AC34F7M6_9BILA